MNVYQSPYLIQRIERARHSDELPVGLAAKYQAGTERTPEERTYINDLMPLDYMGSSEFELGAFGKAMKSIVANRADFRRFKLIVTGMPDNSWYKMPGLTESNVELFGFAHKDHILQVKADIILMAADLFTSRTKERIQLRDVFGVVQSTQFKDGKRLRKSILSLEKSDLSAWLNIDNLWAVGSEAYQMDRIAELLGIQVSS